MRNVFKQGFFYFVVLATMFGNSVLAIDFSVPVAHATQPEEGNKVTICHVPPGNPENSKTIEVDEEGWNGHDEHELDYEGPCEPNDDEEEEEGDEGECVFEIIKTDDVDPVAPGGNITYQITVTNVGDGDCRDVRLKDFFDANTSYVDSDPAYDADAGGYLVWYLPTTMEPDDSEQVELTMQVSSDIKCDSVIKNEVKVLYKEGDSDEGIFTDPVVQETTVSCEEEEPEYYTIKASKVVCESEEDLPNWGNDDAGDPAEITSTTAQSYVDASQGRCWLEEGWDFQWGTDVGDPGKAFVGPAGDGWQSFDSSTGDGTMAEVMIEAGDDSVLKFREVLPSEDYLTFAWDQSEGGSGTANDVSAEIYCYDDILNYDNYDFVRNPEAGETYYCVAFNVNNSPYSPYCGDGVQNQEWEQCDGTKGCTEQCQEEETNQCSDLVLARYNVDSVNNTGDGDMSSDVYLGSASYVIPAGAWFPLYWGGSAYSIDADIASYEDVPGLAVQRLASSVRTVMHTTLTSDDAEEVEASLEFYNATATGYSSDSANKLENSGAHPDSVTVNGASVDFYLWANTGDDGFYSDWSIVEDCDNPEYSPYCGDGVQNQEWEQCDPAADNFSLASLQVGCSEQCQYITDQCIDLVAAKVNVDDVKNWGNGDMTNDLYLGSDSYVIPQGVWFALYYNGSYYTDGDIASYEDVEGLAVQRLENSLRTVMYGTGTGDDKEHVSGDIEFYNATLEGQSSDESNDNPGNNKLEEGFNNSGVGNYNASDDEVWEDEGKSHYWLTTTTADDGFYSDWAIVDDCSEEPVCYEEGESFFASEVIEYEQGKEKDGSDVKPVRSVPENGLELELGQNESNFFSLGFGGWITVAFDDIFVDGPGNDIKITEDTWGGNYPLEKADVYVSQNGSTWKYLGEADNTNLNLIHTTSEFDLASAGLSWGQYIKIIDTSDPSIHNSSADGYDLNAVEALSPGYVGECKEVITVCKVDDQENPLSGWEMTLYGTNLVVNGGFETPSLSANSWSIYSDDSLTSWVVEAGDGLEIQNNAAGAPHGGNQLAELDSNNSSVISQIVPTVVGQEYVLSFWYSPRPNIALGNNTIDVNVDGDASLVDDTIGAAAVGGANTNWVLYEYSFVADDTATKITFSDAGNASDSYGGYLDDVVVRQVVSGLTEENGCVEFEDMPYDTYLAYETMQENWTQVEPNEPDYFVIDFNEENNDPQVTFVNQYNGGGGGEDNIPVITLIGDDPVEVVQGSTYTDDHATAYDVEDGDITGDIVVYNPVDTSIIGSYTVTYNVKDSDNNDAAEVTRTVNVVPSPEPAVCGDFNVDGGEQCDDGPEGSESCSVQCELIGGGGGPGGGPGTPFVISNLNSNLSCEETTISWNTSKISDTIIEYGTTSGVYTETINNDTNTTNHSVVLSSLLPDTTYYYIVKAVNGTEIQSGEQSFTTPPAEQCEQVLGERIESEPQPELPLICNFLRASGSSGPDTDLDGVFEFPNGSLLRDACDPKESVYLIKDQKKWHVPNWQYLHDHHFGQRIYNVLTTVLNNYPDWTANVLGVKVYGDGTLLRTPDKKVYVIEGGKAQYISTLEELAKYAGKEIVNISYKDFEQYK